MNYMYTLITLIDNYDNDIQRFQARGQVIEKNYTRAIIIILFNTYLPTGRSAPHIDNTEKYAILKTK